MDDGILEVAAVKGSTQMAASKVIGLTPQRLWQARTIEITLTEGDPIPIQVDGEAWLQPGGTTVTVKFKNSMKMLCRDKSVDGRFKFIQLIYQAISTTADVVGRARRIPAVQEAAPAYCAGSDYFQGNYHNSPRIFLP